MNTKFTLTTLIAAATLAVGGFAVAQSNLPTSTAGNGCTATANAMKGGNLSASPANIGCTSASNATAPAAAVMTEPATASSGAPVNTTGMGAPAAVAQPSPAAPMDQPVRMARADRI